MDGQDEKRPEEMPPAVGQVNGESDTLVARAGVEVRRTPRPIPAEPVESPPDPEQAVEEERREVAADGGEETGGGDGDPGAEPTD
ncbi:hypothetical protein MF672_037480 [Actinomadura sp. ATCC 31491]|uniref:Uncharacterized protein n=1 Tax=Actinomadura luzonensis TaxID=2805427 RepID=A0ABT0G5K1_9ACTN|nr:hypothetical protein [Actinomadura luzonensis]MCK2219450.1 hypothetical protein [Actinomadura luzonensis]